MKRCSKEAWARCTDRIGCEMYAEFADGSECDQFNEKIVRENDGQPINPHMVQPILWIAVTDRKPQDFVSVLGYMTDAGVFPAVRECYTVDGRFFFPALAEFHPVSHWAEMPQTPQEGKP